MEIKTGVSISTTNSVWGLMISILVRRKDLVSRTSGHQRLYLLGLSLKALTTFLGI